MLTEEEVKESILKNKIKKIEHHACSICGVMVYYEIHNEQLYFDSGCGCSNYSFKEPRCWSSISNWINMQKNEKYKNELLNKIGL